MDCMLSELLITRLSKFPKDRLHHVRSVDVMLKTTKYTEEDLMYLMDNCSIGSRVVLETQKDLSIKFCRDYILNKDYWIFDFDSDITILEVLMYQTHLKESDFR